MHCSYNELIILWYRWLGRLAPPLNESPRVVCCNYKQQQRAFSGRCPEAATTRKRAIGIRALTWPVAPLRPVWEPDLLPDMAIARTHTRLLVIIDLASQPASQPLFIPVPDLGSHSPARLPLFIIQRNYTTRRQYLLVAVTDTRRSASRNSPGDPC